MICEYGCGAVANYQLKNKKWCCSDSANKCPELKRKRTESLKLCYKEGRRTTVFNDPSFDTKRAWSKGKTIFDDSRVARKNNVDNIFCEHSKATRWNVRKYIIKYKLLQSKCDRCDLTHWQNEEISLELHHKNGVVNDHRLENLQFLCPNCHSLTNNFRLKKK